MRKIQNAIAGGTAFALGMLGGCGSGEVTGAAGAQSPSQAEACLSNRQFFVRELWPNTLSKICTSCHTPDGIAAEQGARLSLLPDAYPGFIEANMSSLEEMIKTEYEGTPLVLAKPTGKLEHGGGKLFDESDPSYVLLSEWVARSKEDPCATPADVTSLSELELLSPQATFRKAALHLTSSLPSESQRQRLEEEGEAALPDMLDELTREEAFYVRLVEIFNDVFLTDRYFPNSDAVNLLDDTYYPNAGAWYDDLDSATKTQVNHALAREPLELIAYVLRNDLPFTEVLTAPYTVVNPYTAALYDVNVSFDDDTDADEWKTSTVEVVVDDARTALPHAGILTNPMWLNRFPTTETNRNRHRARMVMQQFLATDILRVAERPIDPQSATRYNNPTRDDPSCAGCHRQIDPIAGAFMKWNYRDQEELLPSNPWYPEMFPPGFGAETMPVDSYPESEQWLASRIVADPRFALSVVHTFYRALTGHEPLTFPATGEEEGAYADKLTSWELQDGLFREIAGAFVDSSYDARTVITRLVNSPYFRAKNVPSDVAASAAVLRDVGTGRLLSPEALDRKLEAVTGIRWTRAIDRPSYLLSDYRLLYGGIDSTSVITRLTAPNGIVASVQWRMANELACSLTAWEFTLSASDRKLLPAVEIEDAPRTLDGDDNPDAEAHIRDNLVHLYDRVLGQSVQPDDPAVELAWALWRDTWEEGVLALENSDESKNLPYACQARKSPLTFEDLPDGSRIQLDEAYTIRAWMAVLSFMFSDYEFLYE